MPGRITLQKRVPQFGREFDRDGHPTTRTHHESDLGEALLERVNLKGEVVPADKSRFKLLEVSEKISTVPSDHDNELGNYKDSAGHEWRKA